MLRPAAFLANARDMAGLQAFLARQAPRYGELETPCVIVSGDRDGVVPLPRHAIAFAAAVPHAELLVLAGIGHMAHHAAPERIVAAIERVVENSR
jgi:pimeloyl-ACP methyl ester carboxylesterase